MKSQRLEKNDRDGFQAMSVSTEIDSESSEDDTWRRRWRGKVILYTSIAFISAMILVFVNFNTGEKNAMAPKVPKNSQHSNMSGGDTHAVSTPSRPEWTGIFSKDVFNFHYHARSVVCANEDEPLQCLSKFLGQVDRVDRAGDSDYEMRFFDPQARGAFQTFLVPEISSNRCDSIVRPLSSDEFKESGYTISDILSCFLVHRDLDPHKLGPTLHEIFGMEALDRLHNFQWHFAAAPLIHGVCWTETYNLVAPLFDEEYNDVEWRAKCGLISDSAAEASISDRIAARLNCRLSKSGRNRISAVPDSLNMLFSLAHGVGHGLAVVFIEHFNAASTVATKVNVGVEVVCAILKMKAPALSTKMRAAYAHFDGGEQLWCLAILTGFLHELNNLPVHESSNAYWRNVTEGLETDASAFGVLFDSLVILSGQRSLLMQVMDPDHHQTLPSLFDVCDGGTIVDGDEELARRSRADLAKCAIVQGFLESVIARETSTRLESQDQALTRSKDEWGALPTRIMLENYVVGASSFMLWLYALDPGMRTAQCCFQPPDSDVFLDLFFGYCGAAYAGSTMLLTTCANAARGAVFGNISDALLL